MNKQRLGIIQSRGLGDLVIALPIAGHYRDQGWDIYWPILEAFMPSMTQIAPWVNWIPLPYDHPGAYFYDIPYQRLKNLGVTEYLPLYQHLTGHDFSKEKYFEYTSFDQYKYIAAGIPFLKKWDLAQYIQRDLAREQSLYDRLITNPQYCVLHLEGSDHRAKFDRSMIPQDWQIIEIKPTTDSIWDWLTIIDRSESLVMVDSVFANITDQLGLGSDRYFIQRSHIGLTPVQGHHWEWLNL
jgi:hypothetical protein